MVEINLKIITKENVEPLDNSKQKKAELKTAFDKEKKKIYGYLLRKGFYHEEIRQVIQVSFWNA
mgnify:CR=1 FL=1